MMMVQIQCIGFSSRREAIGDKALLKDKRRQRTRIRSMRRKCDMTQRRGDVDRRRWSTGEGKGRRRCQWADTNLTGSKNKENQRDRFSCYKWTVKI
jgi:hypothetical protein